MIDPVAFHIGPLAVRWYGLLYGAGLGVSLMILHFLNRRRPVFKNSDQILDLAFWVFLLGVIMGGRLGYVLFYNLPYYLKNPLEILSIWQGGMSFHGGLMGSLLVGWRYCKKHQLSFLAAADLVVIPASLAVSLGRLGNFINRELMGRVIENPKFLWLGTNFGDSLPRYPSPLFQSAEALLIFVIVLALFTFKKNLRPGTLFFTSLILFGAFRFFSEFFREPDTQIGYLWGHLTLGQWLSLAVFMTGLTATVKLKVARSSDRE